MTDAERCKFLLDIVAQIRDCATRAIEDNADRHWQYMDEINSNAAYALRKAGEKDNGQPR